MNVRFCAVCRSLILADFRYCPYCGVPVSRGPGMEEALEEPFERIAEDLAKREALGRFSSLAERLDRLENEMDILLAEHCPSPTEEESALPGCGADLESPLDAEPRSPLGGGLKRRD